ncbi:MAG: nucleoside monophosphate kinase [Bryobacterales bacterium]|nr:nucleoside monophosphate kinase [Bryobacterales bacterium]
MHKYIMVGPQGSGKGTQAKLLCQSYDFVHISIGDIFRWNVAHHTKLAARIKRITDEGRLVPDEIVEEVVRRRLEDHDWNYGFVLDGFPRTRGQAEYLFENWNLDRVIYLNIPDDLVQERISFRARMGEGSGFTKRADDNAEALRVRLSEYHEKTRPLLRLYEERGMLITVPAARSIKEIHLDICTRLGLPISREQQETEWTAEAVMAK